MVNILEMYRNSESLCCVTGTKNSVVAQLYFKNKKKHTNKLMDKEIRFVVTRGRGWGRGNWMKAVKMYKLPVIRQISTRDIMCNMINIINTAICYI